MWLRDFPLGKGTFGSGYVRLTAIAKWKDTVRKYLQLEREKKKSPWCYKTKHIHTQTWWKHFFSSLTYILKHVIMFCDILLEEHFPILSYEQILYKTQLQWEILVICFTSLPHLLSKLEDSIPKQSLWIWTSLFHFPKLCAPDPPVLYRYRFLNSAKWFSLLWFLLLLRTLKYFQILID